MNSTTECISRSLTPSFVSQFSLGDAAEAGWKIPLNEHSLIWDELQSQDSPVYEAYAADVSKAIMVHLAEFRIEWLDRDTKWRKKITMSKRFEIVGRVSLVLLCALIHKLCTGWG